MDCTLTDDKQSTTLVIGMVGHHLTSHANEIGSFNPHQLPTAELAYAIAAEWAQQPDRLEPCGLPIVSSRWHLTPTSQCA